MTQEFKLGRGDRLIQNHEMGRYTVVEFLDRHAFVEETKKRGITLAENEIGAAIREGVIGTLGSTPLGEAFKAARKFAPCVDGKEINYYSYTLEGAALLAFAHAHSSRSDAGAAARYAAMILGVPSDYNR